MLGFGAIAEAPLGAESITATPTQVSADLPMSWSVAQLVSADLPMSWPVAQLVSADLPLTWEIELQPQIWLHGEVMEVPAGNNTPKLLATWMQQPADMQWYVVDYTPWITPRESTAVAHELQISDGLAVQLHGRDGARVAMLLGPGQADADALVTVRLRTDHGEVKEADFKVRIREFR